jgi:hypothetical protein
MVCQDCARADRPGANPDTTRTLVMPIHHPVDLLGPLRRQRLALDVGPYPARVAGKRSPKPGAFTPDPPHRVRAHHEHRALRRDLRLGAGDRVEVLRDLARGELAGDVGAVLDPEMPEPWTAPSSWSAGRGCDGCPARDRACADDRGLDELGGSCGP